MKFFEFECGCRFSIVKDRECKLPLIKFDVRDCNYSCAKVWAMLGKGLTKGVFQLESHLGRQWCKRLKPTRLEHLAALGSILRPGSLQAKDEQGITTTEKYCRRKNHEEVSESIHPVIDKILARDFNLIIFQETMMEIGKQAAGFDLVAVDELRKGVGSKDQAKMAKVGVKFLEGVEKTKVISKELGEQLWENIKKSGRYAFNLCAHGKEIIKRAGKGGKSNRKFTIEEMYRIRNDINYAKQHNALNSYKQWKFYGDFRNGLSLCEDGRIRQNIIKDIRYMGKADLYEIVLDSGKSCKVTLNHSFPTNGGKLTVEEIQSLLPMTEVFLMTCGQYEISNGKKYNFSDCTVEERNKKTGTSGTGAFGPQNRWWTNGGWSLMVENDKLIPKKCNKCGKENGRLELHHISGDRADNRLENLERLCVSCHKKEEYKNGRVKRGEKGYPAEWDKIIEIKFCGADDVYDVEMEAPNHTFCFDSGILTCNSHAHAYGVNGYWSAIYKAHFPLYFFTAYLKQSYTEQKPFEEINELVNEAKLFDIEVKVPSVLNVKRHFDTDGEKIYFGLVDIKGVGDTHFEKLRKSFGQRKPQSWYEFLTKHALNIGLSTCDKLIKAGALDAISNVSRNQMLYELYKYEALSKSELAWVAANWPQYTSLLNLLKELARPKKEGGGCSNKNRVAICLDIIKLLETPTQILIDDPNWIVWNEKLLLGEAITCSKTDSCDTTASNCTCKEFLSGRGAKGRYKDYLTLAVTINEAHERLIKNGDKKGQKFCRLIVQDNSASLTDIIIWPEKYSEVSDLTFEGNVVLLNGFRNHKDSFEVEAVIQL